MRLSILLFAFLLFFVEAHSQETLTPILTTSYGSHGFSNRNNSFFSLSDSNSNVYNIGTTERDTTFTDVLITKLNPSLKLQWQRKVSFGNTYSHDEPLAAATDSNDNIVVASHSGLENGQSATGTFHLFKYSSTGQQMWSLDFGEFYKQYVFFENDAVKIVLVTIPQNTFQFRFISVNSLGQIESDYIRNDVTNLGITGYSSFNFKPFYHEGKFHILYRHLIDNSSTTQSYLKTVTASGMETISLNATVGTSDVSSGLLTVKAPGEYIISFPSNNFRAIKTAAVNSQGATLWTYITPQTSDYTLFTQYVDASNNFTIISSRKLPAQNDPLKYTVTKFDSQGTFISETENPQINVNSLKRLSDGKTLVYSGNKFWLLDTSHAIINQFDFNEAQAVNDYTYIDNLSVTAACTNNPTISPGSQLNNLRQQIFQWKLKNENNVQTSVNYSFSGLGCSMTGRAFLAIDKDDNYILATSELMTNGVQSNFLDATRKFRLIKYNSNFQLLWQRDVNYDITNVSFQSPSFQTVITDSSGNIYLAGIYVNDSYFYRLLKYSADGDLIYDVEGNHCQKMFFDHDGNLNLSSNIVVDHTFNDYTTSNTIYNPATGSVITTQNFNGLSLLDSFRQNNDLYLYFYDGRNYPGGPPHSYKIYKNGVEISTVSLSAGETYKCHDVDDHGNFVSINMYNAQYRALKMIPGADHQFSSYSAAGGDIVSVSNNGRVFSVSSTNSTYCLYNSDLTLNSTASVPPQTAYNTIYSYNNLFLTSYYGNSLSVFSNDGTYINSYNIPNNLQRLHTGTDSGNNLITVNYISNNSSAGLLNWSRIVMNKLSFTAQSLGIEEVSPGNAHDIRMYPNPASGIVHITSPVPVDKIQVYDVTGKLLIEKAATSLDISALPAAIYIAKIYTSDGQVATHKIIRQ